MSDEQEMNGRQVEPPRSATRTWRLVLSRELEDLWIGGKGLVLILLYSVLLGLVTYVIASNSELSLIPPKEMVYETLKVTIAVSLFVCLIIGADSLSGERERATLETLLLTPASRRQIVAGKFLAAVSPSLAVLAVSLPYLRVLSQGDEIFGHAVLWGFLLVSVMAPAYAGLGVLVSFWSKTNKNSYLVALGIYMLLLVPAQLPGRAQTGAAGHFLQWLIPAAAANDFLAKILVNNRTLQELWYWLVTPVLLPVLVLGLLFLYASPGLRLEGGRARTVRSLWSRLVHRRRLAATGLLVIACLMLFLRTSPSTAFQKGESNAPQPPLQISIDLDYKVVKAGDPIFYKTLVTNNGRQKTPPLTVAMNIINLDSKGDVVDPEDWSPERTQYIEQLAPGESASLSWKVNAIFDGDYMVYMVVIPEPDGQEATSQPVASSGIHLTVTPFTRLNPAGVLPWVVGTPIVLVLGAALVLRRRRRAIDTGAS